MRIAAALVALLLAACLPWRAADAQTMSVAVSPTASAPSLGRVVRGTSASVFTINASTGAVTRTSGNAVRITTGAATTPTVTIRCTGTSSTCTGNSRRFSITIQAAAATGGNASVSSLSITTPSGATVFGGPSYSNGTLTLTVGPFSTLTFKLGMAMTLPSTGTTGEATLPFTVTVLRTA